MGQYWSYRFMAVPSAWLCTGLRRLGTSDCAPRTTSDSSKHLRFASYLFNFRRNHSSTGSQTVMISSPHLKWYGLALLSAVQFMVVLDIAIVNVALPSIQTDLHFSQENLQWVVSAYALAFGGFLLLGGRTADVVGRRRVFVGGILLFTLGSLLCGLAWS